MKGKNRFAPIVLLGLAFVLGIIVLAPETWNSVASAQGPTPPPKAQAPTTSVGTAFTYQGQLKQNGTLVSGACDLQFGLWDSESDGVQVSGTTTQTVSPVNVTNGLFTVQLDFGANAFNGDARYLAITARCPVGSGSFANLDPREPITPAPYALTALKTAYKNVIVVAKSGGHYNTITDALNSITDNSATNPYLIYVAPGTYAETVTMKPYVDIEGAGELTTKITFQGTVGVGTGTVLGADNAELRFLTVENTGGSNDAIAIFNSSASPRLTHVTASAFGGIFQNFGVYNTTSSSPTMADVTAIASGASSNYTIFNISSSPTLNNSVVNAGGGTQNVGLVNSAASGAYTVTVNNSQIMGSSEAVLNDSHFTTRISTSQLNGAAFGSGTWACVFVYNASYIALNSSCQ